MVDDNYPQPPKKDLTVPKIFQTDTYNIFPDSVSVGRLNDYEYFEKLFMGDHFTAFNIRIDDPNWNKTYSKLRYVKVNFAGLISKVVSDMLFSEPITVKVPDGDQDFVDALWFENKMDMQVYESALTNSYMGDDLFKLRVGKRNPTDEESTIIAEEVTPAIYFPIIDPFNVRAEPSAQELAWTFTRGKTTYLRKEIHTPGMIENKLYEMQGNKIVKEIMDPRTILGNIPGLEPVVDTGIERSLIIHVPNWKTGNRHFGISDYYDLDSIFYAINNRLTKTDNILDKHSDPILAVPSGVIDEKGNVRKKALGVIEVGEGERGPEYIVWDASLENAYKEVEKLVEFMYLIGEISPDVLGLGQGVSDSGLALKFKLMRTIAKTARKKLYYDRAIKETIYVAQLLAKAHGIKIDGVALTKEPVIPEIDWADGLPIDNAEQIENETKAIDAGLTTKKASIMRIYGVDEKTADTMLKDIKKEDAVKMPVPGFGGTNPFNANPAGGSQGGNIPGQNNGQFNMNNKNMQMNQNR